MGRDGRAAVDGLLDHPGVTVGVPDGRDTPLRISSIDRLETVRQLGGNGDHGDRAAADRQKLIKELGSRVPQQRRIVGARLGRGQERPLEVDAGQLAARDQTR